MPQAKTQPSYRLNHDCGGGRQSGRNPLNRLAVAWLSGALQASNTRPAAWRTPCRTWITAGRSASAAAPRRRLRLDPEEDCFAGAERDAAGVQFVLRAVSIGREDQSRVRAFAQ